MKIKALSRPAASGQAPGSNTPRLSRNLNPELHPFERAREYTRALNATKLERMFAQPFLASLEPGHVDGVYSFAKDPESLQHFASGSGDGVVKVWDLVRRSEIWQAQAHENMVKGMCWTGDQRLLTCGSDCAINLFEPYATAAKGASPTASWVSTHPFSAVSHHRSQPFFAASGGNSISIYQDDRPASRPSQTLAWPTTVDTVTSVSMNQTETSILASCATDRSIVLYDLRTNSPLHRTVLAFASNAISWNPMEAFNFAVANEDHNVYLFDMRNMQRALNVLKGHVAAAMSVDFSPTGEGLVSGSYDRTLRLWDRAKGHSTDVYHTKRMQRLFAVAWTPDNRYVLSGSDDGNVRLWRAKASARHGVKPFAQQQKEEYDDVLKQRYQHLPEIRRIARHRHLPKQVKKAANIKNEEIRALQRREDNVRRHSHKKHAHRRPEREKMVLAREE